MFWVGDWEYRTNGVLAVVSRFAARTLKEHGVTVMGEPVLAGARKQVTYRKIMVPVDGSDLAEAALPHAVALAGRFHASLELVRAYTPSPSLLAASAASSMPGTGPALDPAPFIAAGRQEADVYLERLAASLASDHITVSHRRLDGGAAESIVQAARNDDIDMILMTTHGRGGIGRMVLGSVADYVLRHATCPVLLVRVDHAGKARARGTST